MSTQYTPGPWEISAGDIWPVNGNPRVKICSIIKPSPMNMIDYQANARLISAAPDMLEALQLIKSETQCYEKRSTLEKVYRAIAKATGVNIYDSESGMINPYVIKNRIQS